MHCITTNFHCQCSNALITIYREINKFSILWCMKYDSFCMSLLVWRRKNLWKIKIIKLNRPINNNCWNHCFWWCWKCNKNKNFRFFDSFFHEFYDKSNIDVAKRRSFKNNVYVITRRAFIWKLLNIIASAFVERSHRTEKIKFTIFQTNAHKREKWKEPHGSQMAQHEWENKVSVHARRMCETMLRREVWVNLNNVISVEFSKLKLLFYCFFFFWVWSFPSLSFI